MKKSTEAYNKAVKELDAAVKEARKLHMEAVGELTRAQDKARQYSRVSGLDTKTRLEAETAQLKLKAIEEELKPKIMNIWKDFDTTAAQIRRDLAAVLEDADTYRAADMDTAAVALLNSGTMRLKDFQAMAAEFSESPAVLAILRKTAKETANKMTDPQQGTDRGMLLALADEARTDSEKLLKGFDDLSSVARMYSHRDSTGNFTSYWEMLSTSSLDAWEYTTAGIIPSDDGE